MQYRKRYGDRKDGRKIRSIQPMNRISAYIMPDRIGASNLFRDRLEVSRLDAYIRRKRAEGLNGFGFLHVLIAAYVRTISQRPGLNRYIGGQELFARDNIVIAMVVKKELKLSADETVVKLKLTPYATAADVYEGMNNLIQSNRGATEDNAFDGLARVLNYIPRPVLKLTVWLLRLLDYYNKLPLFLQDLSPFHASLFITSMGSLGIPPIYHHLYDFGNVPIFVAYGAKYFENELESDGSVARRSYLDMTVTSDERICDGHYFASGLKFMRDILRHPEQLDVPPESIVEDEE